MTSYKIHNKPIGPISFGLMGLTHGHAAKPVSSTIPVMKAALTTGANFFNGGDFYGTPSFNSLHLLKAYLDTYPSDAKDLVISIKSGIEFINPADSADGATPIRIDNSPANVRKCIDAALEILDGKGFIDVWEPARVDPGVDIEVTVAAIAEYVKAGKIGGVGLSECGVETIRRAHKVWPITSVEVELSLFATDPLTNGIASTCAELGIVLLGYAPLSHGLLTGQIKTPDDIADDLFKSQLPRFQKDVFDDNLRLVGELEKIAKEKNCTPAQIAISWVTSLNSQPGMPHIISLPGASSVARAEENSKNVVLTEDEMKDINELLVKMPVKGGRYPAWLEKYNGL